MGIRRMAESDCVQPLEAASLVRQDTSCAQQCSTREPSWVGLIVGVHELVPVETYRVARAAPDAGMSRSDVKTIVTDYSYMLKEPSMY
jgi:hypothetical protein